MTSVRPSLAAVPRWAVLVGIGSWSTALHVVHLGLVQLTGTPVRRDAVVASLLVWTALTAWGLLRRERLTAAEVAVALSCGAVAITADGILGGSPGHAYLVSSGLLALGLGISASSAGRWVLAGDAVVLVCQTTLLLALLGTGPLGVYVALTTAATAAFTWVLLVATQLDLQALVRSSEDAAQHDPLTGLLNRRGLAERFGALRAAAPPGQRIAAAVLDLDHFKVVNDTRGHEVGDQVLQLVADALRSHARADDLVVRLGGEELAWFGAWPSVQDAEAAADDLRRTIRATCARDGSSVTASVGLAFSLDATHAAPDAQALSRLLVRADTALYQAKHSGRDRVVVATAPTSDGSDPHHDGAPAPQVRDGGSGRAGAGAQRA